MRSVVAAERVANESGVKGASKQEFLAKGVNPDRKSEVPQRNGG
jgi:hypothetical protein